MPGKVKGRKHDLGHGIYVYVEDKVPKTDRGYHRIWLHIRQGPSPKFETDEALIYVNSADLRFIEKRPGRR
jgi:hypothetical protein